jgi:5-methylcytosine-specific restriction endonuclease McrA
MSGGKRKSERHDRLRMRLFIRQFGLCHWCGSPMSLQHRNRNGNASIYATLEHVKRKADGGTLYYTNAVVAHGKCNSGRHGQEAGYQEHLERMRKRFAVLAKELEFHDYV